MANRLPIPGSDNGNWGQILNDYLSVELAADGTLKKTALITGAKTTADTALAAANGAYTKSSSGIPATDLTSSAQASLTKADTSVQTVNGIAPTGGNITITAASLGALASSDKGIANGVAGLDGTGKLNATLLTNDSLTSAQVATELKPGVTGGTATKAAVDTEVTVRQALPAGVTGTNQFDPVTSLYNLKPASLRRWKAKFGAALAGNNNALIACAGTSITEGVGAATKPNIGSYPVLLRQLFAGRGVPISGTAPVVIGNNNPGNEDGRWVLGANWTHNVSGAATYFSADCSTVGQVSTFTSDAPGTVVEVAYQLGSGPFNITIDGGSATTVTPAGGSGIAKRTFTGQTDTTHVITVAPTTTTACRIISAEVRRTSGLRVANFGIGSSKVVDWGNTASAFSSAAIVASFSPDLLVFEGTINDTAQSETLPNVLTALNNLIDYNKPSRDILLVVSPLLGTSFASAAKSLTYRQQMYAAADAKDVPLLDLHELLGTRIEMIANGVDADGNIHLNNSGNGVFATGVGRAILP